MPQQRHAHGGGARHGQLLGIEPDVERVVLDVVRAVFVFAVEAAARRDFCRRGIHRDVLAVVAVEQRHVFVLLCRARVGQPLEAARLHVDDGVAAAGEERPALRAQVAERDVVGPRRPLVEDAARAADVRVVRRHRRQCAADEVHGIGRVEANERGVDAFVERVPRREAHELVSFDRIGRREAHAPVTAQHERGHAFGRGRLKRDAFRHREPEVRAGEREVSHRELVRRVELESSQSIDRRHAAEPRDLRAGGRRRQRHLPGRDLAGAIAIGKHFDEDARAARHRFAIPLAQ